MPLPATDTVVTFPAGSLTERATVRWVEVRDDRLLIITDRTPFHPEDPNWPDQGSDAGTLANGSRTVAAGCRLGASDGSVLHVGTDIPVRRGTPGWSFVVVHTVDRGRIEPAVGDEVTLAVDAGRRDALSAGHTGCHLAALALNAALAGRWRKPARQDSLGHPDFDQAAITTSRIEPFGSVDEYRIGRSLRRGGFDADGLAGELPSLSDTIDRILNGWVATRGAVRIDVAGPGLTDRREWVCGLPEGTARIPCGGTHVPDLAALGTVRVFLELTGSAQLAMRTHVGGRPAERHSAGSPPRG